MDNYDNSAYLRVAVDSALAQEGAAVEVVVVDDGSPDDSAEVIRSYGDRVTAVLKENGGQGSAVNAGFAASTGDPVIFLDSDDRLEPWAARTAVEMLGAHPEASRLQWPLRVMDADGDPTGEVYNDDLEAGDFCTRVLEGGPYAYRWAATSGNAWPRRVLDEVLPMDATALFQGIDNYLSALAPLFGPVLTCDSMTWWRKHDSNYTSHLPPFEERLAAWVVRFDAIREATEHHAARLGLPFDRAQWLSESWFHRIERAVAVIEANVPREVPLVLLDQDAWEVDGAMHGRPCRPFLEWEGRYAGLPADGPQAVDALEEMTGSRPSAVAVAWPAFWWLEHYDGLERFLEGRFRRVAETPDIRLYVDPGVGSAHV